MTPRRPAPEERGEGDAVRSRPDGSAEPPAPPAGVEGGHGPGRLDRIALLAEFDDPDPLVDAVCSFRDAGYRLLDTYSPMGTDDIEAALALPRTRLPWAALVAGLVGAAGAYLLQWWINVVDYPLDVGGRPLHSGPAFIPITFETAILFAASALFFGFFWRSGMPSPWRPVFEVPGFDRASVDRYWLAVDRRDPRFDETRTFADALALDPAPLRVVTIDEDGTILREERPGDGAADPEFPDKHAPGPTGGTA